jgi:hypothetical protein
MSDPEENERGFTIVDRRGTAAGEEDAPAEEPTAEEEAPAEEPTTEDEAPAEEPAGGPFPEADFPSFLLSLATSALHHLGLVADPESGARAEPNLALARHTIDTLALLQRKTEGNRTDEEEELLANLLTELRMRFVDASK